MKRSILIVEDDLDIQRNLCELLELEGYTVKVASDGAVGLEVLRSASVLPSVILLDLMLPVMDGWEFRREQKRDPKLGKIPVVLMTAGGDIETKAARMDAAAFLKKPFDLETVLETVRKFLG